MARTLASLGLKPGDETPPTPPGQMAAGPQPLQLQEPKEYMLAALLNSGITGKPTAREKKLMLAALEALGAQAGDYLAILQKLEKQVETSNLGIVNALSFL